jgi:hypothetical protein
LKWSHDVVYLWLFANTHNFCSQRFSFQKTQKVSKGKTPIVQNWEAEQKHRIQKHWINTSDEEEEQEEQEEALSNHWTCSIMQICSFPF